MSANNTDTQTKQIELSGRQLERFEQIKEECTDDYLPEPTDEQIMKSLMDTWNAVGNGHYSDDDRRERGDLSPEEAAFGHVRRSTEADSR